MNRCSKVIYYAARWFFARPVVRIAPGCFLLSFAWTNTAAQTPGGVSSTLSAWFKANTQTGNVLPNNSQGTPVNEWKSELGNLSVTQSTTSKMPLFLAAYNTGVNFNFNPCLQFAASQIKGLVYTGAAPDLLGNKGTYFLVLNTFREPAFTSSTCFSYISPATGARYQAKADFRIQTGTTAGFGYIADLNPAATSLNPAGIPAITYQQQSAILLTSRSAGSTFRCRRNADTTILGSDAIYYPAVGSGLGIGFSAPGNGEATSSAIAEVITYNSTLTDADVNKVETYLAIKYGITLSQGALFTLPVGPTNYTLSDGSMAWDAAANNGYGHNITGIGRDDGSALAQMQSKSVHDSALVYLYNGTTGGVFPAMNKDNTSGFTTDKSVLLAGDNGLSRDLAVCLFNGKMARMNRVWKVQKTGAVNTVTIAVDATDVNVAVKNLLVSSNPLFPAAATTFFPLQQAGGKLYAEGTLNNNDYFTFATDSLQVQMTATQPTCSQPTGGSVSTLVTGGIAPYTYSWNTTPVQSGATASGMGGGNYILTATSIGGCASTFPITLVTPPVPVVNATALPNSVCPGTPVTLTASVVSGTVNTLTWKPGGQNGNSLVVTPADTTTYSVIGDAGGGCADTVYVTVNVKPLPSPAFTIGPDTACIGTAQTITYTGGAPATASYDWNNFSGATIQTGSGSGPYNIVFSSPGTYTLQLQVVQDGCISTINTAKAVVSPQPLAGITLSKSTFCAGDTVTVRFSGSAGSTAAAVWNWGGGAVKSGSGFGPYSVKYINSGVIKLSLKDGACSANASLPITVISNPLAAFTPDVTMGCVPLAVHFTNQSVNADAYQWKFGNGNTSTETNPLNTYAGADTYTVTLIASHQGKCYDTLTQTNIIKAAIPPVVAFSSVADINIPVELRLATYTFTNLSQNAASYEWTFGDGNGSTVTDPVYQYMQPGSYIVTLYATTDGCTDSVSRKYYTVIPDKILDIPNAFSPNGDGINDRWEIKSLNGYPDCIVEVFNRWGQPVYNSKGYRSPWDGGYKNSLLPLGTYYYVITAAPGTRPYKGWVVLLR